MACWAEAGRGDPSGTIAAVVQQVAAARGAEVVFELEGESPAPSRPVAAIDGGELCVGRWGPWLPGFVREAQTSFEQRHDRGVHHTPPSVVEEVLSLAIAVAEPLDESTTVLDPAVGGAAFLLAVAERMPGPKQSVANRLAGVDVDPLAVAAARAAVELWAGEPVDPGSFVVADFLAGFDTDEVFGLGREFDLVVGNPPFLSQLRGGTARSESARQRLAERWPGVGRYVDDAAAFLLASVDLVNDQGTVALVQPASLLAASDAGPVRAKIAAEGRLAALWVDRGRSFAAGVDTVAVVVKRGDRSGPVATEAGPAPQPKPKSWAPLLASANGVPFVERPEGGKTLGDVARVTAGFRDQYYGLIDAVEEGGPNDGLRVSSPGFPLITSGVIDPLRSLWGERATRFAKRSFTAPVVRLDRVDPKVVPWVRQRLVPKVLVASQTKVIEAIADPDGVMVPCTPVVTVEPTDDYSVWHLAAFLTSPIATSWMIYEAAGSALSPSSVRVSAAALAALPLADNRVAWDRAAEAARMGDIASCGAEMMSAHGVTSRSDLLDWWTNRIPTKSLGI